MELFISLIPYFFTMLIYILIQKKYCRMNPFLTNSIYFIISPFIPLTQFHSYHLRPIINTLTCRYKIYRNSYPNPSLSCRFVWWPGSTTPQLLGFLYSSLLVSFLLAAIVTGAIYCQRGGFPVPYVIALLLCYKVCQGTQKTIVVVLLMRPLTQWWRSSPSVARLP